MKRLLFFCFVILFLLSTTLALPHASHAEDSLEDITKKLSELTQALNQSVNATKPLESQLKSMQAQVADIKNRIAVIEIDIGEKKKDIDKGYKNLETQHTVFKHAVQKDYIQSYYDNPLCIFLCSSTSAEEIVQQLKEQETLKSMHMFILFEN